MGSPALTNECYTWQDYQIWDDKQRWEIIDGEAYAMTAPCIRHQEVTLNIAIKLKTHPANTCYTGIAPTDVVFDDYNVVQPDVFLICDRRKITDTHIQGAPDLIVEVISPSTGIKDRRDKKNLYEHFAVKEYILIYPDLEYAERYLLEDSVFRSPEVFNWDESFHLTVLDIEIRLWEIFDKAKDEKKPSVAGPERFLTS